MFRHYLITRFNLRNPKWDVTKNNEALLTDEWLEHRLQLFQSFCLPSVAAQSSRNFTWLICFDTTTTETIRGRVAEMIGSQPNIRIVYVDGMPEFYPEIKKLIDAETQNVPYLITSRIDNDDCIHRDFIAEVQQVFAEQDYRAVDIIKGYSLQVKPVVMLGKKEHIFNPFISLIEKNADPKTVWFSDHNMWKNETRITRITHKRLWMSIIHEKNKVNEFDGYGNVNWNAVSKDFVVADDIRKMIGENLVPFNQWRNLSRKNFLYVKMVLFSKMIKRSLGIYKLKRLFR